MSGDIGQAVADLVAALEAAAIPATADPGIVLAMLADSPMVALVGPPTVSPAGLSGQRYDIEVPVHLACRPPGGFADWAPLWDALPTVISVVRSEARAVALTVADISVPAYRLTATESLAIS